jgi:hypothetical protein
LSLARAADVPAIPFSTAAAHAVNTLDEYELGRFASPQKRAASKRERG